MAVETRARATSERRRHGATVVLEPLREQAQMAVALEPLRKRRGRSRNLVWERTHGEEAATMVLEPLQEEALTKVGASGGLGAPCSE